MNCLSVLVEYVAPLTLAMGAIIAIVSYLQANITKKKTAATLIVNQIDEIEKNVDVLLSHKVENILTNEKLYDIATPDTSAWNDNKHVILNKLSEKDYELIETFFAKAKYIFSAKKDIEDVLRNHWSLKDSVIMKEKAKMYLKEEKDERHETALNDLNRDAWVFVPNIAFKSLFVHLELYNKLSGTTAYDKLKMSSYRRKY